MKNSGYYILIFSSLLFLSIASLSDDSFINRLSVLAQESQFQRKIDVQVQRQIQTLQKSPQKEAYESEGDNLKAIALLKEYPFPSESTVAAYKLIEDGIPDATDKQEFLKNWAYLYRGNSKPYLQLVRRVINTSEKFNLSPVQREQVGQIILGRAKRTASQSGPGLELMMHLTLVSSALDKDFIRGSPETKEKLSMLRNDGLNRFTYLNKRFEAYAQANNLTQADSEHLAQLVVAEYHQAQNIRNQLLPLLQELQ